MRRNRLGLDLTDRMLGFAVAFGLAAAAGYLTRLRPVAELAVGPTLLATALGAVAPAASRAASGGRSRAFVPCAVASVSASWVVGSLTLLPVDPVVPLSFVLGALLGLAVQARARLAVALVCSAAGLVVVGSAVGAGAWSVDEPSATDPRMVRGNGIVVELDTHAFLLQQGAVILRNDGHEATADFLASPDPRAPRVRDDQGRATGPRESYLWRMQLGARDADRRLKPVLPDHFFNWWTHSGKGLIAGRSAATYAEQEFARAVASWRAGERSAAMYHLGAATHLVDDACTPPHEFFLVPNHRAYEDYVLARQDSLAVGSGGVYAGDFRVHDGHGGREWSSAHTRGWVDECSHRAAGLVLNTAQGPPDSPTSGGPLTGTFAHFRDTQRLTAGYLAFFFDSVGAAR